MVLSILHVNIDMDNNINGMKTVNTSCGIRVIVRT